MNSKDFDPVEYEYLYNISENMAQSYMQVLHYVTYDQILYLIFYIPTALVAFIGNVVVLAAFIVDRKQLLKVNFNWFIVNLSFIDLLVSVVDMPFTTAVSYHRNFWPRGKTIACAMVLLDDWMLTMVSMITVVGISIDRYWAACWSQHYRIHNTRARTHIFIAGTWFCGFAVIWPPYIYDRINDSNPYSCNQSSVSPPSVTYFNLFSNHIPILIMVACSFKVYQKVRKGHRASVHPKTVKGVQLIKELNPVTLVDDATTSTTLNSTVSTHSSCIATISSVDEKVSKTELLKTGKINLTNIGEVPISTYPAVVVSTKTELAKERKIFNSLRYVVAAILILWTPYYVYLDLEMFWQINFPYSTTVYIVVSWLFYMNSAVNPFMYAFGNPKIRLAIERVLKFIFRR